MIAVEALEHPESATELDFFGEKRVIGFERWRWWRSLVREIVGESVERQLRAFDGVGSAIAKMIHRDPPHPRPHRRLTTPGVESSDDADEHLLSGVGCVFAIPSEP